MIVILASIGIIVIFASEAKKRKANPITWALTGLATAWLTSFLPVYLLIEYVIGHRNDAFGILTILLIILLFFYIGAMSTHKIYNYLKERSQN